MRTTILLFLFCASMAAQIPVYTSVSADNISWSSARIKWTLESESTSNKAYCYYGTDKNILTFRTETLSMTSDGTAVSQGARINRVCNITGVPPNTKIYFRPVTTSSNGTYVNSTWGCTGPGTASEGTLSGVHCDAAGEPAYFVTTARADGMPIAPNAPNPELPVITNAEEGVNRFTVAADCSDLKPKLASAVAAAASQVTEVVIPARTECKDVVLPAKPASSKAVLIRSSESHLLPPSGVRVAPEYAVHMAKFTGSRYRDTPLITDTSCAGLKNGSANYDQGGCSTMTPNYVSSYHLRGIEIYPTNMRKPNQHRVPVSVTAGGTSVTVVFDGEQYPWTQNDYVLVYGNTRITPANQVNGVREIAAALAGNSFRFGTGATVTDSGSGSWPVVMHSTGQVVESVTPQATECSGDAKVTVPEGLIHGLQPNTNVTVDYLEGLSITQGFFKVTVLDDRNICLSNSSTVTGTHVRNTGFIGVDAQMHGRIVDIRPDATDITLDQCYIHGWAMPNRTLYAVYDTGRRTSIINSVIDRVESWNMRDATTGLRCCSRVSINTTTPSAIFFPLGQGKRYENNLLDGHGIMVFSEVSGAGTAPRAQDFVVRRNHVKMNKKYLLGSPVNPNALSPIVRNYYYTSRQPFECKSCLLGVIEGNWFDGNWADAAPFGSSVTMTLRTSNMRNNTNEMRDLDFRYNLFSGFASGFQFSNDDAVYWVPPTIKRIRIAHNVLTDCDWWNYRSPYNQGSGGPPGSVIGGTLLYTGKGGLEDFTVEHNSHEGCFGNGPWIFLFQSQRSAGIVFRNNVLGLQKGYGGGPGIRYDSAGDQTPVKSYTKWIDLLADFTKRPDGTADPNSKFHNNAILRGVWQNSGSDHSDVSLDATNAVTMSQCQQWFGTSSTMFGNVCLDSPPGTNTTFRARMDAIWENRAAFRFAPRQASPLASGNQMANSRTTARTPFGVDMRKMDEVRGVVRNVRVAATGRTTATVSYIAPDSAACALDYSSSAFPAAGVIPIRVNDGGGDRVRNVSVTGLSSGTLYHYRVQCAAEQTAGEFVTRQ